MSVAKALDTAQRGMGLAWDAAREVIARSLAEAHGAIACGAGPDQLSEIATLDQIIAANEEQCEWIESRGGRRDPDGQPRSGSRGAIPEDYSAVYSRILRNCAGRRYCIGLETCSILSSQDIGAQTIWIRPRKPALR